MSSRDPDYSILPSHMQDGMKRYLEDGIPPGDFLYLILCNDFVRAAARADIVNKLRLFNYAHFLYEEAPAIAWGSPERVQTWMDLKRKERKLEEKRKANERSSSTPEG